ncbi:MAG: DUF3054 domain-containing protein [Chloroflexota bacterium]
MNATEHRFVPGWLIAGDLLAIALVTLFGFATHGELGSAGTRMLTTFVPLCLGWMAAAPALGLFNRAAAGDPRQLWRPLWAMLLGGPLAAWLRAAWLGAAVLPVFVFVLSGVGALGLLAWRALALIFLRRQAARR